MATFQDLDFIDQHDPLLRRPVLSEKIGREEVYVAEESGRSVGLARFNYFCDLDPFLTLIFVLETQRRRGFGRQLIRFWEQQMRGRGHRFLLTSTQADEDAQFFYRKIGFEDTGSMLFPGYQVSTELVLMKRLKAGAGPGPRRCLPRCPSRAPRPRRSTRRTEARRPLRSGYPRTRAPSAALLRTLRR